MGGFLGGLPKGLVAFLAIAGGIFAIILINPPHTVCDSQLEVIKVAQRTFLYREKPNSQFLKTTKYEYNRDRCKATNDPGGCYELFQGVKMLLQDMNSLSEACGSAAGSLAPVKSALWETSELLVRLAWGEKPPVSYNAKFGWLDVADRTLFCKLKARVSSVFGEAAWTQLRERMMTELPGAKEMARAQVWELSLFSENCARYP